MKGFDDFEVCLGDIMRGERATMGKSLLDVQRELKIKATYIAAIENADPSVFESPGFIAGYVRSYARYLGLDTEWAYGAFCAEGRFEGEVPQPPVRGARGKSSQTGGAQTRTKARAKGPARPVPATAAHDPLAKPSVRFVPAAPARFSGFEPGAVGSMAVLLVLIGGIGYGGWSVLKEVQKVQFTPVEQTPVVLADLDPVAPAATATEEGGPDVADADALDRLYRPKALELPVMVARDAPISTFNTGAVGVLARDATESPRAGTLARYEPPIPDKDRQRAEAKIADDDADVQVVAEGPPRVELFAVRPAWVRVRAADGTVVLEKILDAGERFELPATEEAHTLRAGNATSVYFSVGGDTYGPAGGSAAVVKNVILSPEALTAAYRVADLDADSELARWVAIAEALDN